MVWSARLISVFGIVGIVRVDSETDRDGDLGFGAFDVDCFGAPLRAGARNTAEIINSLWLSVSSTTNSSPPSVRGYPLAQRGGEAPAQGQQHWCRPPCAERIVDLFEVVEVDEAQGNFCHCCACALAMA